MFNFNDGDILFSRKLNKTVCVIRFNYEEESFECYSSNKEYISLTYDTVLEDDYRSIGNVHDENNIESSIEDVFIEYYNNYPSFFQDEYIKNILITGIEKQKELLGIPMAFTTEEYVYNNIWTVSKDTLIWVRDYLIKTKDLMQFSYEWYEKMQTRIDFISVKGNNL